MATSSREARRRRIVDRGTDRLALITGQIETLPSSSSSSPSESQHSHAASCPPLISRDHHDQDLSAQQLSHQSNVSYNGEDKSSSSLLLKVASASECTEINANDGGNRAQPVLRKSETSTEALRTPWEVDSRVESSRISSMAQNPLISTSGSQHHVEPQVYQGKFFTPNQISSAIAASESTRIYCSLAAAILVVLSYVGFPVLGSHIIKGIIFFRPLFLVLLTNISIVISKLLSEKRRGLERIERETNNVPSISGNGLAEQVGKALELGLVLQSIMGAVLMDCSVYTIVVVCGLSLLQKLGW